MKGSLHHGFPFQLFTFPSSCGVPLHSQIPPGSSVLIFCPFHACPLTTSDSLCSKTLVCCLPQILLSLLYSLTSSQASLHCFQGREAGKGDQGGL